MNNNVLLNLIKLIEPQVVSVLIAKGLVHLPNGEELKFNNCTVSDSVIPEEHLLLNEEFLSKLRSIYPKDHTCSLNVLRARMKQFIAKTTLDDISQDEVEYSLTQWLNRYSPPYCGKLINFLFLTVKGIYTSRLEDIILQYRDSFEVTETSRPQVYDDTDI